MNKANVLLGIGLAALLAACAPQSTDLQPPDIVYGQEACASCGMLIDDPKFAAALILENGEPRKFDDLGEMFAYAAAHPDEPVRAWFAHDYHSEAWVNAEAAYFVVAEGLGSPMGYGIAAFELESDAQTFAAERNTDVLRFAEVLTHPTASNETGMH